MRYRTATAFRVALEHRLLARSQADGLALPRLRKRVVFERLLARLLVAAPERWMLKGGLALDFRLGARARSTVDMDLGRHDDEAAANADFDAAQEADLGDYFEYDIIRTARLDTADVAGAIRYQVRVTLAERRFEEFVVDVGFSGSPIELDEVIGPDLLTFADLAPIRVPTLPLSVHIAEKVHAYMRQYGDGQRPNTGVKDLVDLVLLTTVRSFRAGDLRQALTQTFAARMTQPVPTALPDPPAAWGAQYLRLAQPLAITTDSQEAHQIAAAFLDPILRGEIGDDARWDTTSQRWTTPTEPPPS